MAMTKKDLWNSICWAVTTFAFLLIAQRHNHNLNVLHERVKSLEAERNSRDLFDKEWEEKKKAEKVIDDLLRDVIKQQFNPAPFRFRPQPTA